MEGRSPQATSPDSAQRGARRAARLSVAQRQPAAPRAPSPTTSGLFPGTAVPRGRARSVLDDVPERSCWSRDNCTGTFSDVLPTDDARTPRSRGRGRGPGLSAPRPCARLLHGPSLRGVGGCPPRSGCGFASSRRRMQARRIHARCRLSVSFGELSVRIPQPSPWVWSSGSSPPPSRLSSTPLTPSHRGLLGPSVPTFPLFFGLGCPRTSLFLQGHPSGLTKLILIVSDFT